MIYQDTQDLIDAIKPYAKLDNLSISTENTDWKGRPYQSDLVRVHEKQYIGFEVFDNEIRIDFFDDHVHFENWTSDDQTDRSYVLNAKEFLVNLYTLPIVKREVFKGNRCVRFEYFFITQDSNRESMAGIMNLKLFTLPFMKKTIKETTLKYQITTDDFQPFFPQLTRDT